MPCWSQRSETGVCSRRWSRRMATFSWAVKRLRVFLGMGAPPLEVVAYSSRRLVPFQLRQSTRRGQPVKGATVREKDIRRFVFDPIDPHRVARWDRGVVTMEVL